jgi:hypothetical protein
MRRSFILGAVFVAAMVPPLLAAGADRPAVVTILEGNAVVFRDTAKLAVSEGIRVWPNDLVETGKNAFVRLEFEDGTRLDLGPGTQLQVNHPAEIKADRPALYMLSGWIKLSVGNAKHPPPSPTFATPLFDGTEVSGVALARVNAGGGAMFVEQGRARFAVRRPHVAPAAVLAEGDFVSFAKDGRATVGPHPSSEFLDAMPRAFRDSIPSRLARYRDHEVASRTLGEFSYGDVEAWINSEPAVRRQFVRTWREKADDPAFRLELTGGLNLHPEWGPVLFPELYAPKPPPAAPAAPAAASVSPEGPGNAADASGNTTVGPPWPLPEPGDRPQ